MIPSRLPWRSPLPAGEKLGVILGQNIFDLLGGAGQVP